MVSKIIVFLVFVAIIAAVVYLWNNVYFKKYRRYIVVATPVFVLIVVLMLSKKKGPTPNAPLDVAKKKLKDDLFEAQLEASIEITAVRTKNQQMIDKLKEVKKIPDKKQRREKLAELLG